MTAPSVETPTVMSTPANRKTLAHLHTFSACCWETASFTRPALAAVREASQRHSGSPVMLNSCQRLEVYGPGDCEGECEAPQRHSGHEALMHLAEVAAGLHSVVLGEVQILGQVRQSLAESPRQVREVADIAIAAARDLRRETEFGSHSGHLLDRALRAHNLPNSGSLLVIGTGQMGRLIAQRAAEIGFTDVTIVGRRMPEGDWLERHGFRYLHLDNLREAPAADVVLGCLGSNADELDPVTALPEVRSLIVDLGTPRNFGESPTVPLATIASLVGPDTDRPHTEHRRSELRTKLANMLDRRLAMATTTSRTPLGSMRHAVEETRLAEMERLRRAHPEIPEETLNAITRSLVNKIFHTPSERLRRVSDETLAEELANLFRRIDDAADEAGDAR